MTKDAESGHVSAEGLLVLARSKWLLEPDWHLNRRGLRPSLPMSVQDIACLFRGLSTDREPWPDEPLVLQTIGDGEWMLSSGLVGVSDLNKVQHYYKLVKDRTCGDLLYVQVLDLQTPYRQSEPSLPGIEPVDMGFDYGFLISAWGTFSVIDNDVIFGRYLELTRFATRLNQYLLLSSLEEVVSLDRTWRRLLREGKELEDCEPMAAIHIYGLALSPCA